MRLRYDTIRICKYLKRVRELKGTQISLPHEIKTKKKLENVAIIAMYCHLRPPDAIAFPTSFGASNLSCRRTQCCFIYSRCGRIEGVQWTHWDKTIIVKVGKNSGPVLSRLYTKVHEILRQRRRPFILSNALARLSMSRFVQQIFAIKFQCRRKTEQM